MGNLVPEKFNLKNCVVLFVTCFKEEPTLSKFKCPMSLIIVEVNEENEGYLPELSQDFCYKKTFLDIFFVSF